MQSRERNEMAYAAGKSVGAKLYAESANLNIDEVRAFAVGAFEIYTNNIRVILDFTSFCNGFERGYYGFFPV